MEISRRLATTRATTGHRLPAERQWASDLGISRHQVRKALERLERDGTIIRQANSGYFLATSSPGIGNRAATGKRTLCLLTPYNYSAVPDHPVHLWNREARKRDYVVNLAAYSEDAHDELEIGEHFIKNGLADGFFWLPSHRPHVRELALAFDQARVPVVALQYGVLPGGPSSVGPDYWRIGVDLSRLIVQSRSRRVLLMAYAVEHLSLINLLQGVRQVLGADGEIAVHELLLTAPPERPRAEAFMEKIRQAMTAFRPDFVFAGSRVMSECALEVMSEQKVRLGQDCLFAGLGIKDIARNRGIDAASFEVDWPEILDEAFGLLDRQIRAGPGERNMHVRIPVRLMAGQTLGTVRQEAMAGTGSRPSLQSPPVAET